jgi:hypothetical protein
MITGKLDMNVERFKDAGYVRIGSAVSRQDMATLKMALVELFRTSFPEGVTNFGDDFDDPGFDAAVIRARGADKVAFGRFYDICQTNVAINRVFADPMLLGEIAELMDCSVAALAWSGSLLRIDVPDDRRNTLGWHQDQHYLPFNRSGRGIVVSIQLSRALEEMGALHVAEGSHQLGVVNPVVLDNERFSTQQLSIPDEMIDPAKVRIVEAECGDAVCLDLRTIHRSGFNSSQRVRWSCLMRFHDSLDRNFLPFRRMQQVIV